jgi:hypothetical protein
MNYYMRQRITRRDDRRLLSNSRAILCLHHSPSSLSARSHAAGVRRSLRIPSKAAPTFCQGEHGGSRSHLLQKHLSSSCG